MLPRARRGEPFEWKFRGRVTAKHLIEGLGVPHTEVGKVLANEHAVQPGYQVRSGDRLRVLPVDPDSEACDDSPGFVLDNHLGRLAGLLRLLGFDVLYRNDYQDEELAAIASQDSRILLTRDRRLLMRKSVIKGYCVRHLSPQDQLIEVVMRFRLVSLMQPFRRCPKCNALLARVDKQDVLERLETLTRRYYDEFHICPDCQQIYWKGSHYERMMSRIDSLLVALSAEKKNTPAS